MTAATHIPWRVADARAVEAAVQRLEALAPGALLRVRADEVRSQTLFEVKEER